MRYVDPLIGRRLANYRVERILGFGGMARVYLGWDENLLRPVAIKVISERYRDDPAFTRRFIAEARAAAAWRHPNILQIYYAGELDGIPYYVMEYVRGLDLEKILRKYADAGELMPVDDLLSIGNAIGSALDYAHNQGVVHRDVKPANVILEEDGRVILADFGLARKLSQETRGEVFGSPHYIPPEQARNSAGAVPASDLYSLGVILYEALTGQVPFDDPSPAALALKHIQQEPPPARSLNPNLSAEVEAVLRKALSKQPAGRYHSGQELLDALQAALQKKPASHSVPVTLTELPEGQLPHAPRPFSNTPAVEIVSRQMAAELAANLGGSHLAPSSEAFPNPTAAAQTGPQPLDPSQDRLFEATLAPGDAAVEPGEQPTPPEPVQTPMGYGAPADLRECLVRTLNRTPASASLGCGGLLLVGAILAVLGMASILSRNPPSQQPSAGLESATPAAATWTATAARSDQKQVTAPTQPATNPTEAAGIEAAPETQPAQTTGQLTLYYNDSSLYIINNSGRDLPITPLTFERLDANGDPSRRLKGWYWAQIYAKFRDGYCIVTEIYGQQDYINPPECKNRELIVRTPSEDEDFLFWRSGDDSREFRVLWNGKEAARCEIAKGTCKVNIEG